MFDESMPTVNVTLVGGPLSGHVVQVDQREWRQNHVLKYDAPESPQVVAVTNAQAREPRYVQNVYFCKELEWREYDRAVKFHIAVHSEMANTSHNPVAAIIDIIRKNKCPT